MVKKIVLNVLLAFLILIFLIGIISGVSEDIKAGDDKIIIKLKDKSIVENYQKNKIVLDQIIKLNKKFKVKEIEDKGFYVLSFPKGSDLKKISKEYGKIDAIDYVELDYRFKLATTPNDPNYGFQWAYFPEKADGEKAWNITTGSSDVVIAILDSGVDYNHFEFQGRIWGNDGEIINGIDDDLNGYVDDIRGWDFPDEDNNPMDENGHGTHTAGIAAAKGNNNAGVAGTCWGCKIMPIKVCGSDGMCYTSDVAPAIRYAVDNGAKIISMSLYADDIPIPLALKEAVDYAVDNGALIVAAAGNENSDTEVYPAGFDNVLAVGAIDYNYEPAGYSNYGEWVDVAAPGQVIFSTKPGNNYGTYSGTSMATPFVSGLAGLLLSENPELTNVQLRNIITSNVDSYIDTGKYIGTGVINFYKAVKVAQAYVTPSVPGNFSIEWIDNRTVVYSWDESQYADGYTLYMSSNSGGPYNGLWSFNNVSSFTSEFTYDTDLYFVLTSFKGEKQSGYSDEVHILLEI